MTSVGGHISHVSGVPARGNSVPGEGEASGRRPRHDTTPMSLLLRERASLISTLTHLGFREDISWSILRYWIMLKVNAPAGGPYALIGVALAAVAEVREREGQASMGWFAGVLNEDMLQLLRRHSNLDLRGAKALVSRIMLARWERLVKLNRTLSYTPKEGISTRSKALKY
ncbi:hypothetical protein F4780DRAFT_316411 [Xylariomycetidae sp. FL0641]|nr:hypothetical protein F4780DRAFT_316411 [Xylariomycetidae sp. FL0641]